MNGFIRETRSGIFSGSAVLQFALLASCTTLIVSKSISPAETLVALNILGFATAPALVNNAAFATSPLLLESYTVTQTHGYGMVMIVFMANSLWCTGLTTWFWARGYAVLPQLGTSNTAFFFTHVQLGGWFRVWSLLTVSIECVLVLAGVSIGLYSWGKSVRWWWQGKNVENEGKYNNRRNRRIVSIAALVVALWGLPFQIAATEKMIVWNNLEPEKDLRSPGQLIPFVLGLYSIIDSALTAMRHVNRRYDDW